MDADFEAREADFEESPSVWTAADLISAAGARAVNTPPVDVARDLLVRANVETPALRQLLRGAVAPGGSENLVRASGLNLDDLSEVTRARIVKLRRELRSRPRSALRWIDLALSHITLGNTESANKAVQTALAIAPRNRFVLRSASRFFVHTHNADEALFWLERTNRVVRDPWLLAAHIAVSQVLNAPIRHVRPARELLADGNVRPLSASELSAALGSEELRAGRTKPARLYMAAALREPTDNSVAQAVWSQERGLNGLEVQEAGLPHAYEAETLASLRENKWDLARLHVEAWVADEPFSVRAAVHGSYIAITGQEDYEAALQFARLGMRGSPSEPMLLNNAAFALANLGRLKEAEDHLNRAFTAHATVEDLLEATRGLVAFRQGRLPEGRLAYRNAEQGFRERGEAELASLCLVMLAREEIRSGSPAGVEILNELSRLPVERSGHDATIWINRIRRGLRRAF